MEFRPSKFRDPGWAMSLPEVQGESLPPALLRALEAKPMPPIPQDFAERVARKAVRQPVRRASLLPSGWGPRLAIASAILLVVALCFVAPHATHSLSNPWYVAEIVLLVELCVLLLFAGPVLTAD